MSKQLAQSYKQSIQLILSRNCVNELRINKIEHRKKLYLKGYKKLYTHPNSFVKLLTLVLW